MLFLIIFVISLVACLILGKFGKAPGIRIVQVISVILAFISFLTMFMWLNRTNTELESIKSEQIELITAYQTSPRGIEEWEWLKAKLEETNAAITNIETDTSYSYFDLALIFATPNYGLFKVRIETNRVVLPETYKLPNPKFE